MDYLPPIQANPYGTEMSDVLLDETKVSQKWNCNEKNNLLSAV